MAGPSPVVGMLVSDKNVETKADLLRDIDIYVRRFKGVGQEMDGGWVEK